MYYSPAFHVKGVPADRRTPTDSVYPVKAEQKKRSIIMENFFNSLTAVNDAVNTFVWVKLGLWLLIAVGVIMTVSPVSYTHLTLPTICSV